MTQSRAVLDFIGFPVHVPGNLECRFQKGIFRDDGTWIDDGSRSGKEQKEKHRVVLSRGQNVRRVIGGVADHLSSIGYDAPEIAMIRHVAQHEWRREVISERRARLKVKRPELRLVVRAIGFDIEGRGELAVGVGKATIRPNGEATLTQKSGVVLQPGDPLPLFFEACDMLAERIGYLPLGAQDRSLIEHVTRKLWTKEVVSRRHDAWSAADAINGERAKAAHLIEFAQRLDSMSAFRGIPAGAIAPSPEPMRSIIN